MLVIAFQAGETTTLTDSATGETIKLRLVRGGPNPRIGIECERRWDVLRSNAIDKSPRRRPIQESNDGLDDIARRPE